MTDCVAWKRNINRGVALHAGIILFLGTLGELLDGLAFDVQVAVLDLIDNLTGNFSSFV